MASKVYHEAIKQMMEAYLASSDDIRCALLMTSTDANVTVDAAFLDDLSLDECDGTNYARKTFSSEAVTDDDTNDRAEFDAEDLVWSALGNGAREIEGALIYLHVTDDTDSVPICYIEFASTINPGGGDLTVTWDTEGILQGSSAT